jgi:hypothetical protein
MYWIYVFDKTKARRTHFKQLIHKILVAESTQKTVVWDVTACILVIVYQVLDSCNIRSFLPSCPNSCCFARQVFFLHFTPLKRYFISLAEYFCFRYSSLICTHFLTAPSRSPFSINTDGFRGLKFNTKYKRILLILNVYTVRSESRCALTKVVGSDVHERLYRLERV